MPVSYLGTTKSSNLQQHLQSQTPLHERYRYRIDRISPLAYIAITFTDRFYLPQALI